MTVGTDLPPEFWESWRCWQPDPRTAGIWDLAPRWSSRRGARGSYALYVCLGGTVTIRTGDRGCLLQRGDAALIPPGTSFADGDESGQGTRQAVLDFHAVAGRGEPWSLMGLPAVVRLDGLDWIERVLRQVVRSLRLGPPDGGLQARGLIDHLLGRYLAAGLRQRAFPFIARQSQPAWLWPLLAWIDRHLARQDLDVPALARRAGLTRSHFTQAFARSCGEPPARWVARRRIQAACQLLQARPDLSIAAVGCAVGITDPFRFSRCFARLVGCPPSRFRQQQAPDASGGITSSAAVPPP